MGGSQCVGLAGTSGGRTGGTLGDPEAENDVLLMRQALICQNLPIASFNARSTPGLTACLWSRTHHTTHGMSRWPENGRRGQHAGGAAAPTKAAARLDSTETPNWWLHQAAEVAGSLLIAVSRNLVQGCRVKLSSVARVALSACWLHMGEEQRSNLHTAKPAEGQRVFQSDCDSHSSLLDSILSAVHTDASRWL